MRKVYSIPETRSVELPEPLLWDWESGDEMLTPPRQELDEVVSESEEADLHGDIWSQRNAFGR